MRHGGKHRTSSMNGVEKDTFLIDLSLTSKKCYMSFFHVLFLIKLLDNVFISYQSVKSFIHKFKGFSETEFSRLKTNLVSSGFVFEIKGSANMSFLLVNPFIRKELEEIVFSSIKRLLYEIIAIIEGEPELDGEIKTLQKNVEGKVESLSFNDVEHLFSHLFGDLNGIALLRDIKCRNKHKLYFTFSLNHSMELLEIEKKIKAVFESVFRVHFDAGVHVSVEKFWRGGREFLDVEVDFCENKGRKSVWKKRLVLLLESLKKSILR